MLVLVGFMRNNRHPQKLAKLTALICSHYNIELIYIRPRDVDIESNTVTGIILVGEQWKAVTRELPSLIDISQYCFKKKNKAMINHLRNNSKLTFDQNIPLSKEKLQSELSKDDQFHNLVIPTQKIRSFDTLTDFITEYKTVVMKPIFGQKGKGVYILNKISEDQFKIGYRTSEILYSRNELLNLFNDEIYNKNYIAQKYISSRTKQNDPFDCRIHVQKNRNGEWELLNSYIRIGIGQKVMSNVNQGGGVSDTASFLKANFDENAEEINKRLINIAEVLPYKIEKLKQVNLMTLGFDIAIDNDGEIYLFESNGSPTIKNIAGESALRRVEYYLYILDNQKISSDNV